MTSAGGFKNTLSTSMCGWCTYCKRLRTCCGSLVRFSCVQGGNQIADTNRDSYFVCFAASRNEDANHDEYLRSIFAIQVHPGWHRAALKSQMPIVIHILFCFVASRHEIRITMSS